MFPIAGSTHIGMAGSSHVEIAMQFGKSSHIWSSAAVIFLDTYFIARYSKPANC